MDLMGSTIEVTQGLLAFARELLLTLAAALSVILAWRQVRNRGK